MIMNVTFEEENVLEVGFGEVSETGGFNPFAVLFQPQTLTEEQQAQARENISTLSEEEVKILLENSGGNAEDGEDGFSPIATVTQTDSGAVISITDKEGTTTATITNGKDGAKGDKGDPGEQGLIGPTGAHGPQGKPGKDGTSATHSWNGTVLTITSASGTSSADLKGAKGDKGDKGDTGAAGKDGANGKDYVLTDADKSEIAESVKSAIGVPDAVVTEASRVVNTALTREDSRILRFIAFSDAHQKNDHEQITAGNKELGQGIGEILRLIGVDFVANLGDTTWASETADSTEAVIEQAKMFNRFVSDSLKGEAQLWLEGNHETGKLSDSQIHALVYSHNKKLTQDADHWIDGYGYIDFPNQKVRVICLNTEQGAENIIVGISGYQLKWLAETALNMDGKTDWSVITLAHHPLGYDVVSLMIDSVSIIEAFIKGEIFTHTTRDGVDISADYSVKNCQYVGHFHGHSHAFSIVRMQKYVPTGAYVDVDAWEICIPNACYTRNNQNLGNSNERGARYSTPETYNKSDSDGKRTSFNVVTICLDKKMIYADNFGAGIDREVSFNFVKYVNQLPISADTDGSIYGGDYNGDGMNDGYKIDTYLSGSYVNAKSGYNTTGFIPIGFGSANTARGEQIIYLKNVKALPNDAYVRLAFHSVDKGYINYQPASQWIADNADDGSVKVVYGLDENGYINKIDVSGFTSYLHNAGTGDTVYFRMCAPGIDENSIITVNQPIE